MRLLRFCAFVLLASWVPLLAADPKLLSLVPADTEAVMGLDVKAVLRSGVVKELMRTSTSSNVDELNEMIALTGVDPRQDVNEIVVAGFASKPGTSSTKEANGLVFVTGNFDPARVGAAIATKGGKKALYKGRTLWTPEAKTTGGPDVLTFLDSGVLLAGNESRVKRYLDGATAPLAGSLRARVDEVSSRYDIWMVSAISPSAIADSVSGKPGELQQAAGALQGDMFQKIESVQGGLKFGPQTILGLEMNAITPEDATALMNVLQFFQSMMSGAGGKEGNQMPAGLKNMLSSIRMSTQAKTVLVSMSLAEQDIVNFLKASAVKKPAPGEDKPARSEPPASSQPKQEEIIIIQ